ncbi:MAG: ABC transporter substrate-binding protein [Hyphomicrobiaceae bacterium]
MLRHVVAAIAALAVATPALAAKKDNTVRFAYDQVIENVDPYFNNVRLGVIFAQHVFDTLIFRDPVTNEYKPQLATAWKWIDDRTLELELRQGIKFHNGEEFDADDVAYTLNFAADPANKSVAQQNINWIEKVEKVEKVEKFKVRIKAKRNFPAAIEYLAGPLAILPNEYYAAVGPKGMNEKPIGSGPFKVSEHVIGKSIKLERNADYWKDSPKPVAKVERIEIRMIPDRQTQVAEMLAGGLDLIMNVPLDQAEQLKAAPHLGVSSGGTMRIVFLLLHAGENTPVPALKDIRVRRAIAHAIDRTTMAKQLVGEGAILINTICFPSQFGCTDEGAMRYEYDTAKAKKLLAEAGHPDGFELDLFGYRERPQTEAMVNYLRAVGIKANLKFMQYAAMREQHRASKAATTHQTWGSFNVNDTSASTSAYFKGIDDDVIKDPEIVALLEKGDTSIDSAVRKDAYKKALQLIAERAYAVPLYALTTWYIHAKELAFKPYPDEMPRFWEMSWK